MTRTAEVFVAEFTWRCPTCGKIRRDEQLSRKPIELDVLESGRMFICCDGHEQTFCELTEVH